MTSRYGPPFDRMREVRPPASIPHATDPERIAADLSDAQVEAMLFLFEPRSRRRWAGTLDGSSRSILAPEGLREGTIKALHRKGLMRLWLQVVPGQYDPRRPVSSLKGERFWSIAPTPLGIMVYESFLR